MRRLLLLAAVLVPLAVIAGSIGAGGNGGSVSGSVTPFTPANVSVTSDVTYYIADGGSGAACTQANPCATFQPACDQINNKVISAHVTMQALAGWSGTGCHLIVEPGCIAAGDGGVSCGQIDIQGTLAQYAPADGGTGTGTISAVTAGSQAGVCNKDIWSVASGAYNPGELTGLWVGITSGTGSGSGQIWPVVDNDAGVMRPTSMGVATQPVAGSGYTLYDPLRTSAASVLNAPYGQTQALLTSGVAGYGFGSAGNFIIETRGQRARSISEPWIRIRHFSVIGTQAAGIAQVSGGETVEVSENYTEAAYAFQPMPGGLTQPTISRNILKGGQRIILSGAYYGQGEMLGALQVYNNMYLGSTAAGGSIGYTGLGSFWSSQNYLPWSVNSINSYDSDSMSVCDTWSNVSVGGNGNLAGLTATAKGGLNLDGATITQNYGIRPLGVESGATLLIDQGSTAFSWGGPSTINTNSGFAISVFPKGHIMWSPTTVWTGAGLAQITNGFGSGPTVAQIHASKLKEATFADGSTVQERSALAPVDSPFPTVLGAKQYPEWTQHFSGVTSSNTKLVTFDHAFSSATGLDCDCSTLVIDGGVTTGSCSVRTPTATNVTVVTSNAADTFSGHCTGPQ